MKFRTALVLAVILLALGGLATWDEWQTKKDKTAEEQKNRISILKPDEVTALTYRSAGVAAGAEASEGQDPASLPAEGPFEVSAARSEGGWKLSKPVNGIADASTIDNLIKSVVDYSSARVVAESKEKWGEFGLDAPRYSLTLATANPARTLEVHVGANAPVGYNVYFRTAASDAVHMGSQHLAVTMAKTIFDFRDKTLVKIDEAKVKTFAYQGPKATVRLEKVDGKYQIRAPMDEAADDAAVRDLIEEVNFAKVSAFVTAPELVAAFQAPVWKLEWTDEAGAKGVLSVLERDGKVYAAIDPSVQIVTLPEDFKEKISRTLIEFRVRKVFEGDLDKVTNLEIDGTKYQKVGGNWYKPEAAARLSADGKYTGDPKDAPAEEAHLRAFLVDLEFSRTDEFIEHNSPAADTAGEPPVHRITLHMAEGAGSQVVVELFALKDYPDKFLLKRTGGRYVYRVPKSVFNSMNPSAAPAGGEPPAGEEGDGLDFDLPESETDQDSALNDFDGGTG